MVDNSWIGIGDGKTCKEVCKYAPVGNKWPCIDCDMRYHDRAESPEEGARMPDREKVIKGLECCKDLDMTDMRCPDKCPYHDDSNEFGCCHYNPLMNDAITLLKAQEPMEPHYTTLKYLVNGTEVIVHHPECPRCIRNGLALWDAEIEKGQAYCKRCGQAVKWND